ncbi:MAG: signal transduction histidine kinase [Vicingaceae bacterium]|jgi:signal transduction histidine kinase
MEEEIAENIVQIIVLGTLGLFTFFGGVLTFIILYQKKIIRTQKEKQELETQFQKEILHNYIETQEQERQRIASDLHDNVGASLGAVKMMMNQITATSDKEKEVIKECKDIIHRTAESTRQISHNLLPPSLERLGLVKVLERLAKNLTSSDFRMEVITDPSISFTQEQQLALFRITQELTANTLKYANASYIRVEISKNTAGIIFDYFDDGIGFNAKESNGLGLKNITTRVEMIKAKHKFYTEPNVRSGIVINISLEHD